MISVGFRRVSKKRPCRICGNRLIVTSQGTKVPHLHAHQCGVLAGYRATVEISTSSPDSIHHDSTTIKWPISQSVPPAPLKIRDAVFQELIRISPASNYMEELVADPAGLLSRGLLQVDVIRYGALPRTNRNAQSSPGS